MAHQKDYLRLKNRRVSPPDLIIIITEGTVTEPEYFEKFPLPNKKVLKVHGTGKNTLTLIQEAEEKVQQTIVWYKAKYGTEPQNPIVWCVFDKDDFPAGNFGNAINSAKAKGYHVAYSNEAFELWYLLHFNYYDSAVSRDRYKAMLSPLLKFTYEKNNPTMYEVLLEKQPSAIQNAKTLLSQYNPPNPNTDNPSTTVYELVEYLNQYIK